MPIEYTIGTTYKISKDQSKKIMKNILRFTLVLFLVNFVAASILAGVYLITKPEIDKKQKIVEEKALRQVMPESIGDRVELAKETKDTKYWKVFKGQNRTVRGYIFIAKKYGYSSLIETMVGMKRDGTITGIKILKQNETPGLGSKIIEVISDKTILKALKDMFSKEKHEEKEILPYFTEQFKGLNVKKIGLSRYGIEAITGATITSEAVVSSIKSEGLKVLDAR